MDFSLNFLYWQAEEEREGDWRRGRNIREGEKIRRLEEREGNRGVIEGKSLLGQLMFHIIKYLQRLPQRLGSGGGPALESPCSHPLEMMCTHAMLPQGMHELHLPGPGQ